MNITFEEFEGCWCYSYSPMYGRHAEEMLKRRTTAKREPSSTPNEMNVPYDDFEYICPSADEKKTASPTMMPILIAAAVGVVVVIAAGSAFMCTRKRPSKGTPAAMHKQGAVEMT